VSRRTSEVRQIDLNAAVAPIVGAAVIGLGVAILLLFVLLVYVARQTGRLRRRIDGLTRGAEGQNLTGVLDAHLDKVAGVARELDELSARSAVLEAAHRQAIQRVGLVRFNPFEDTGGNQSFALALTDAQGNGLVVTSLHSRTGTRVFAKGITAGRADAALSAEETEALQQAVASPGGSGRVAPPARDA
jgi:hypothetical protein